MRLFRRRRLPAEARPALSADERVVAWAGTGDTGAAVVATTLGLWLPGAGTRLGWHEIHKASWSGRQLTLTGARDVETREGYVVVADRPVGGYPLADPGNLPEQVRIRVNKSIAYTQHHPSPGVRVVARRVPGRNGLHWTVRYDEGVDAADPMVSAATDELVSYGRASIGP